jgi:hypothetical protein
MMTPEDFLRSLIPGEKQPEHLGLDHHIQVTEEESTESYQEVPIPSDNTGIAQMEHNIWEHNEVTFLWTGPSQKMTN